MCSPKASGESGDSSATEPFRELLRSGNEWTADSLVEGHLLSIGPRAIVRAGMTTTRVFRAIAVTDEAPKIASTMLAVALLTHRGPSIQPAPQRRQ
jgi:hypothetical protein